MKEKIYNSMIKWIKLWPDFWALPAVILAVWGSYYLFYWIDPSIGTLDMGVLQAAIFVWVMMVVLNTMVFLGIEFNDKPLWKYYKDEEGYSASKDFNELTPWQRTKLLYFWRAFLYASGVVIFVNLI